MKKANGRILIIHDIDAYRGKKMMKDTIFIPTIPNGACKVHLIFYSTCILRLLAGNLEEVLAN